MASALFTRGETQALVVTTLGTALDEQIMDNIDGDSRKNFMLHYNFPPFSVGEVGRLGSPGRREIGHGHLAERAISMVLPRKENFPYTIRIVSEILESNGSSSMATVCGSTLSLLNAGVRIEKPVAGIAMGLVKEGDKFVVLSDILGRGRSPRRHGLQGRRHRGRDHGPPDGHQDRRGERGDPARRRWDRRRKAACTSWES